MCSVKYNRARMVTSEINPKLADGRHWQGHPIGSRLISMQAHAQVVGHAIASLSLASLVVEYSRNVLCCPDWSDPRGHDRSVPCFGSVGNNKISGHPISHCAHSLMAGLHTPLAHLIGRRRKNIRAKRNNSKMENRNRQKSNNRLGIK